MSKRVLTHAAPEQRSNETPPLRRAVAPLVVGAADDFAERDADRVAHEVLDRLAGEEHVHDGCHGEPHSEPLRRAASGVSGVAEVGFDGGELSDQLSDRIEAARGKGSTLPDPVRRRMEAGFGRSLAQVRVHTGGEADGLARSVSARAFTTGHDIFFGAGEYSPDTAEGERVLAHEIAHTQQQAGGARRLHRWHLDDPRINWDSTRSISTVDSGQAVFILDDGTGKIVVKAEKAPIGLAKLSEVLHNNLSGATSVKHRKLTPQDKQDIVPLITAPDGARLDRDSWAKLGRQKRTVTWVIADLEKKYGKPQGSGIDDIDDVEVGRFFHELQLTVPMKNAPMLAMSVAEGVRAQETTSTRDRRNPLGDNENMMRGLLTDFRHMEGLGRLTAIDLFLGNEDRVMMGNVGNWFYDPWTAAVTLIDHVDGAVPMGFESMSESITTSLMKLKKDRLGKTAAQAVSGLCTGIKDPKKGNDASVDAWLKSEGGYRQAIAEEAMERGLTEGRKTLIKTFSATRWSLGKSGRQARATKKAIKSAAKQGAEIDSTDNDRIDPERYYKILKARAEWLKKN